MSANDRSLWSLIPARIKWSLLPLFTSAFLVGSAKELSYIISKVFSGNTDIVSRELIAFMLLFNLLLALWVFHKVLSMEIAEAPEKIDISARILNFAAIFVTVADLFKLAVDREQTSGDGEISWYILVVIFYFLVFPFFLVVARNYGSSHGQPHANAELLRTFIQMAAKTSAYGLTMAVMVALAVGIFYTLMNDGWQLLGSTPQPVRLWFGIQNRNQFWMINPMLMGLTALQVSLICFGHVWTGRGSAYFLDIPGWRRTVLILVSIGLCPLFAAAMLEQGYLVQEGAVAISPFDQRPWMTAAAATAGMLYAASFFLSFLYAQKIMRRSATPKKTASAMGIFVIGGISAGVSVILIRWIVSSRLDPVQYHLIWMHSVAFLLAFFALHFGGKILSLRLRGTAPLLS